MKRELTHFILVIIFTASLAPPVLPESTEFVLEGVVSGLSGAPDQLSAVINGGVYSPGDRIGNYEVVNIGMQEVTLRHMLSGNTQVIPAGKPARSEDKIPEESLPAKPGPEKSVRKYSPATAGLRQKHDYEEFVAHLKKIHLEALQNSLETGTSEITLSKLVTEGSLSALTSQTRNDGYHIEMVMTRTGTLIYATPAEGSVFSRHFMIDEEGYVYFEEDRRPTKKSPRFPGLDWGEEF